jgi:hypothetical protein
MAVARRRPAVSVITDRDVKIVVVDEDAHLRSFRVGVTQDVRQGLLNDAEADLPDG